MDRRIQLRLRRQYGVVARAQAMADGVVMSAYDGLVQRGRLVPVEFGVHRSCDVTLDVRGLAMAAVLRAGPRAVVAGPLVLRWAGVDSLPAASSWGILLPDDVRRPRLRIPVPVWRSSAQVGLPLDVAGIPCAPLDRSVVESVRVLDVHDWQGLVDQCAWRRRPPRSAVERAIAALPPGSLPARRARAWFRAMGDEESHGERDMFVAFGSLARRFRRQARLTPSIRADGADDEAGLVVEYLGRDHHHAGNRAADAARRRAIEALGYEVFEVRAEDLRRPRQLRARLQARIDERLRERRRGA